MYYRDAVTLDLRRMFWQLVFLHGRPCLPLSWRDQSLLQPFACAPETADGGTSEIHFGNRSQWWAWFLAVVRSYELLLAPSAFALEIAHIVALEDASATLSAAGCVW